jgi:ABC-type phosphate transport system ATPase subunit
MVKLFQSSDHPEREKHVSALSELAGKTDGGSITLNGTALLAPGTNISDARKKIGMVFQGLICMHIFRFWIMSLSDEKIAKEKQS